VEGMLCGLADGLDAVRALGVPVQRILLTGGAAASAAVRAVAPALLGLPVSVPEPAEHVAIGAARQAAWVLAGGPEPPPWPVAATVVTAPPAEPVRQAYGELRDRARGVFTQASSPDR